MNKMLKDIAWNGIHLSVPSSWELGRIATRHLFFDNHASPAMEIKWGPVKGRFSHHSHLKKLVAQQKKHPGKNLEEWHLPRAWKNALSNFIAKGFSWQSGAESGRGAILFCPLCKTAVMFQIFNIAGHMTDKAILDMLQSLQDHRNDDQTAWTVFDIRALLPKAFQLDNFQFKPGIYELAFSDKFQTLKLFRWAPASAFLSQTTLARFAANTLEYTHDNLAKTSFLEHPAVEWRSNAIAGWHHWLYRFKRKPAFHWLRVWHVVKKNRILGIRLDSKKPFDADMMACICTNYVTEPSTKR
jgi:hypothetical protein